MIRVGITGHRRLASPVAVRSDVGDALDELARRGLDPPWTAVSGLAEGADRLAVEVLREKGAPRLVAVLPMKVAAYEKTFPESVPEFRRWLERADEIVALDVEGAEEESYRAAGRRLVDEIDVLLAIWNGRPGKPGGTAEVVSMARESKRPILWIPTRRADDPAGLELPSGVRPEGFPG